MKKSCWIAVLFLFVSVSAVQAGNFYVGAGAGKSRVQNSFLAATLEGDDVGYKGFFGYRFLKFVSAELSFTDFGEFDDSSAGIDFQADIKGFAAFAIGNLPLGRHVGLYAKLGASRTDFEGLRIVDSNNEEGGPTAVINDDEIGLGWAIGLSGTIAKRYTIRAEYEVYETDTVSELEFGSVSFQFNF